jgi:hypothetical protein
MDDALVRNAITIGRPAQNEGELLHISQIKSLTVGIGNDRRLRFLELKREASRQSWKRHLALTRFRKRAGFLAAAPPAPAAQSGKLLDTGGHRTGGGMRIARGNRGEVVTLEIFSEIKVVGRLGSGCRYAAIGRHDYEGTSAFTSPKSLDG